MGKENYFFVKSNHNVELNSSDTELHEINVDDINYLALFATTLEPLPEVTEFNGYAAALEDYYLKNSDMHSDCYHNLVASSDGKMFLCTTIQLVLLEKQFRTSGLNENNLQSYAKCIKDYQHQIEFNQSMYMKDINNNLNTIRKA